MSTFTCRNCKEELSGRSHFCPVCGSAGKDMDGKSEKALLREEEYGREGEEEDEKDREERRPGSYVGNT